MRNWMNRLMAPGLVLLLVCISACQPASDSLNRPGRAEEGDLYPAELRLTKAVLRDKIKGGWAGQVIGCTFGGPTEFRYCGTMIQDYVPIEWDSTKLEWWYSNVPGLYDDIYMDLTFVKVFEEKGLDAPASAHAEAFAHAGYKLWHANQAARYNILHGIAAPESGHWLNNPHADDIDFQIEADFAGLMSPGMLNPAAEICDRVGHIMNYGDGWYGGVYVAAMYALSFWTGDIHFIVSEALRLIPQESTFHKCIADVIDWHAAYPDDWKRTWFEVERKWSSDIGCPDGVFRPFNIDAKINAAYIVIGMLYGQGDFGKTLEISTRCGQDSDCNPASAGGILGTILGYDAIPEEWKQGLSRVEDQDFSYIKMSLNDSYDLGFRQALEMIRRNGGSVGKDELLIPIEAPEVLALEQSFEGHCPGELQQPPVGQLVYGGPTKTGTEFRGKGFVWRGAVRKLSETLPDRVLELEVYIDGELYETALLPSAFQSRRHELCWKYALNHGPHQLELRWVNPLEGYRIDLWDLLIYH